MFYEDARHVYRVTELDAIEWLDHGFGTRNSEGWVPGPLAWVKQIHSDILMVADGVAGCLGQADGVLSATPGMYAGIRTADCIPVLIADLKTRAVAAVHAGWRGSAEAISQKAVRALEEKFGGRSADMVSAIGPGVCGNCYRVGPEVAAKFAIWFPERSDLDRETFLDLSEANRRQLIEAGLDPGHVYTGAPCTVSNPDNFYSWRREQEKTGRMVSAIAVR